MTKNTGPQTAVERAMEMARAQAAEQKAKQKAKERAAAQARDAEVRRAAQRRRKQWTHRLKDEVFAQNPGLRGLVAWSEKTVLAIDAYCTALASISRTELSELPVLSEARRKMVWDIFVRMVWEDQQTELPAWQLKALFGTRLPEFDEAYDELDAPRAEDPVDKDIQSEEPADQEESDPNEGPDATIVHLPSRAS